MRIWRPVMTASHSCLTAASSGSTLPHIRRLGFGRVVSTALRASSSAGHSQPCCHTISQHSCLSSTALASPGHCQHWQWQQPWQSCHGLRNHIVAAASSQAVVEQDEAARQESHRPRLFILDVMAQAYRISHGFGATRLTNDGGQDTSLLHAFMNLILRLFKTKPPPTHFALVVDAPGKTFRHELFPLYKAQRPPTPDDLIDNIGRQLELVQHMGIPILCVPGVEADDVMGSLAVKMADEGADVVIVSPDKDFLQLLSPRISLMRTLSPKAGGTGIYTHEDFVIDLDIPDPKLWADVLALMGDSSDNVPGVKGVGEKTAKELVQRFGDIEGVLAHASEIKRKGQRELLLSEEGRNVARLSKELVSIVTDFQAPAVRDAKLADFKLGLPPDGGAELKAALQEYQLAWVASNLQKVYRQWQQPGEAPVELL